MRRTRAIVRASALVVCTLVMYAALILGLPFAFAITNPHRWRSLIFHGWAKATAAILGLKVAVQGTPPAPPFLLVSNHLSYVDVLVFASLVRCVFVARGDVARWAIFSTAARQELSCLSPRSEGRSRVNGSSSGAVRRRAWCFAEGPATVRHHSSFQVVAAGPAANTLRLLSCTCYRTSEASRRHLRSAVGDIIFVKHLSGLLSLSGYTGPLRSARNQFSDESQGAGEDGGAVKDRFIPVSRVRVPLAGCRRKGASEARTLIPGKKC